MDITYITERDYNYLDAGALPAFVVRNAVFGGAIQGAGDTPEAAWSDAVCNLGRAGITVVDADPKDHNFVLTGSLAVLEVDPSLGN